MTEAYIFDALRTPRSSAADSALYEVRPVQLLAEVFKAMQQRNALNTSEVDNAVFGCVTPTDDQGGNIAKAALLAADWSPKIAAAQLNRSCVSGLDAVLQSAASIRAGWSQLAVAGGVESASRVAANSDGGDLRYDPSLLSQARLLPRGVAADLLATLHGFGQSDLDNFAIRSGQKAIFAQQNNFFARSLVAIKDKNNLSILEKDQLSAERNAEDMASMSPIFAEDGAAGFDAMALRKYPFLEKITHAHTSANSAKTVDAAAAILLGSLESGKRLELRARARIVSAATVGGDASALFDGISEAVRLALQRANMDKKNIDLWEINEDFAVVPLLCQRSWSIAEQRLNSCGGAVTFGHPSGATGAVLLGTLIDELERQQLKIGLVAMSASGGMGAAMIVERL